MSLLDKFLKPKTHKSAPGTHNPSEKVAEKTVASLFSPSPTPVVTYPDPFTRVNNPTPPQVPEQPVSAVPSPEVLRLTRMASELVEQVERMEKDGKNVQHLRDTVVYLSNDPMRYRTPADPRFRPYSPLSTDQLRTLARACDIPARCITHLKSEVTKVPLKVVLRDEKDKSASGKEAVKEAMAWFSDEGGLGGCGVRRSIFEAQLLDDLLVIGAHATHIEFATLGDRLDGRPSQMKALDAATIQPLVTPFGFPVGDDAPAFRQWVQGVQVASLYRDELIYEGLPSFARTDSPYFMSPTEQAAIQIYTLMRVDQWNRTWLDQGSGYRRWLKLNPEVTPSQAKEWLEIMTMITEVNFNERHKIGIAPGEITGDESRKDQDFDGYEHSRIDRICACYGVNPASIGFHSRQYKDSQEGAMDSTREGMVAELLLWREDFYNRLLARMGWDYLVVTEDKPAPNESPQERSSRQGSEIAAGVKTINQVRAENGDDTIDGGDELLLPGSLKPLSQLLAPPPAPGGFDENGDPIPGQDGGQNPGQDTPPTAGTSEAGIENRSDISDDKTERAETQLVLERGDKHPFGCIMAMLDDRYAPSIRTWVQSRNLPLAEEGIETEPHITILYGLHTKDPAEIGHKYEQLLKEDGSPIKVTFGKLMVFRSRGREGKPDFDVLVYGIDDSHDLRVMNEKFKTLDHTSTFPDYKPHMTVAYVAPGAADQWENKPGPLTGEGVQFKALVFSAADGKQHRFEEDGTAVSVRRALGQWERKCLKRIERGQRPVCAFESEAISPLLRDSVINQLADVSDKTQVRALFRNLQVIV